MPRRTLPLLPSTYIARGWCQGHFATDKAGKPINSTSPLAVAWCLLGALQRATFNSNKTPRACRAHFLRLRTRVVRRLRPSWSSVNKGTFLADWNDYPRRTHKSVIVLLKACNL